MKLKEKAIKEIELLNSSELLLILDVINSFKKIPIKNKKKHSNNYLKVRSALNNIKSSFSDDIINSREERI